MITYRVVLHATGDRTKDLQNVNELGLYLSSVPGLNFVRHHPHHLGGTGWYYQVFIKTEDGGEGLAGTVQEVIEERAALIGPNVQVERLYELPDHATCRSCGLISEDEQVVCPACSFRSIDACPHCSVASPAETYKREFGDVHRCPSCDRLVDFGVNWDSRTRVQATPWSVEEAEAVESIQDEATA